MSWRKLGLVWAPSGEREWARSHAFMPTAEVREDLIRVYCSVLDGERRGRIAFVDVAADQPTRVVAESQEPLLDLGPRGTFEDCGVNASCLVEHEGERRLYTLGWQRCERVPYMVFAGLAVDRGSGFERLRSTPVLDRTPAEPYLRSATSIRVEKGQFRAWYVCARGWIEVGGRVLPTYVVKHINSSDGVSWPDEGQVCIDFADDDEFGFGRPWVLRDGDCYRMWYSIRSRSRPYRIGYAESGDGLAWERRDAEVGIAASASGWDSQMICYACVVDVGADRRLMFYNGNGHGETGFGVAEWTG